MASLEPAFEVLMELEGGGRLHTVPGDPGGTTKYGVSQRAHQDVNIAELTLAKALDIYRREYWTPLRLQLVNSQTIATEVFEFAVNAGFTPSVRAAQRAANDVLRFARPEHEVIASDGRIGPQTLRALNVVANCGDLAEQAWADRFNLLQLQHYRGLRPDLVKRFLVGWTRRVV